MRIRTSIPAVTLCVGIAVGCGGNEKAVAPLNPDTVPFSGIVKRDGKPLSKAVVKFLPTETKGVNASGITDDNGKYELKIQVGREDKAGAPPGDYKVTISRFVQPNGEPQDPTKPAEVPGMESIPQRFSDPGQTTLKANVPSGGGTLDFDLKGK
ncbi:MAG: carboxypeptidase regulatory-like domain-containing protein [Planctomycetaceae bacterium]|nr:carboxypeptidase regulatory-like domain-containing protein [Planctomycetaceae bacterium]